MERSTTNTRLPNSFSTKEELVALLEEGRRAADEGRFRPAEEFFAELKQERENGYL